VNPFVLSCMLALAFLLPFRTDTATGHVFYVSGTKVKWNPQQDRLDLTVRNFTNDLEQAIKAQGGPELRLWTTGQHAESDRFVGGYLTSRIKFRIDGAERPLKYVGKADALDATACFLQIGNVKTVKTVEVENRLLIDLFDDQTNVVQFEIGNEKKFVNLTGKLYRDTVRF